MIDRLPPYSDDAEKSILAAILFDPEYADDAFDILRPNHFYREAHQIIFEACLQLHREKLPIDLITVKDRLTTSGEIEKAGGVFCLSSIVNNCPLATDINHYCKIIRDKAVLRDMIRTSHQINQMAYQSNMDVSEALDKAQRAILEIDSAENSNHLKSIAEISHNSLDRYEKLNSGTSTRALNTGFHSLDAVTGGFLDGKLIIIAARPGVGKTTLMLNMIRNMCKNGHTAGIFSIEMETSELDDRLISMESGINSLRLTTGTGPHKNDWIKINEAVPRMSEWNLYIDDTGGLPILELSRRARIMKKKGCEILFIDQFSKIKGDRKKSRFEQKSEIVEYLGDLKKELHIPIVLLAQINRGVEGRNIKRPILSDLKDTGQLEEEADIVLLLDRPELYDSKPENKGIARLQVAKHRNGPCIVFDLTWIEKRTLFHEEI